MFLALRRPPLPLTTLPPPPAPAKHDDAVATVHAVRAYRPGDVVFRFDDLEWRPRRDRETVQHPHGGHVFHHLLASTGHSCEPNCCVAFPASALVAVRPIEPGEPITFDYKTTESWLSHPFWCQCGARRCRGRIG